MKYTVVCPDCQKERQISLNPKYLKKVLRCRICAYKVRSRGKYKIISSGKVLKNCIRSLSEVSRLTGVTKPTVAAAELSAFKKIFECLSEELGEEPVFMSHYNDDPSRMALQRYMCAYYMDEKLQGGHSVASCVQGVKDTMRPYKRK